jgi:NitT/TauT family transport system permease protein
MGRLLKSVALALYPIAIVLAAWEAACAAGLVKKVLLPAPSAILSRLWDLLQTQAFYEHIGQTMIRLGGGLAIATVLGIGLGLVAATSRTGARLLEPLVRVIAPIPKIALYPALILVLGFDHASKIALVAADAIFPIFLATYHGAQSVDPRLVWSARAAGTSAGASVFKVILPASLPSILTGFRIGMVIASVVVFLAEMISSTDGLGHLLVRAARTFRTVDMFVPLVMISALGLVASAGLTIVRRRLLAGFPEERSA